MTYEKHIDELEAGAFHGVELQAAIDAAIDLMRAATPKDAEAEQEHCDSVDMRMRPMVFADQRVRVIRGERAAARAEEKARWLAECNYWRQKAEEYMNEHAKALREYQVTQKAFLASNEQLAAAKAEAKTWEVRATDLADRIDPRMQWPTIEERLREELAAAKAENERLRTEFAVERLQSSVLQQQLDRWKQYLADSQASLGNVSGKLTNLRAEAIRAESLCETPVDVSVEEHLGEISEILHRAIEASR